MNPDRHIAHPGSSSSGAFSAALTWALYLLGATGALLVARGVYLSELTLQGTLHQRLETMYSYQGYLVGGTALEVGALILIAFQYRIGRVLLAILSTAFMNLAFLWTSRGPWDTPLVNQVVAPVSLAFVGVGVDTGIGIAVLDLVFLIALAIACSSVYLLSGRGRLRAATNAILMGAALTLILSLEVYAWDRGELAMHFTSLSPPWFTNFVLGVSSAVALSSAASVRLLLRLRG